MPFVSFFDEICLVTGSYLPADVNTLADFSRCKGGGNGLLDF